MRKPLLMVAQYQKWGGGVLNFKWFYRAELLWSLWTLFLVAVPGWWLYNNAQKYKSCNVSKNIQLWLLDYLTFLPTIPPVSLGLWYYSSKIDNTCTLLYSWYSFKIIQINIYLVVDNGIKSQELQFYHLCKKYIIEDICQ